MFSLNGLIGSVGVLVIQAAGGSLYDNVSKEGPFLIAFYLYVFTTALTLFLGVFGKIRA